MRHGFPHRSLTVAAAALAFAAAGSAAQGDESRYIVTPLGPIDAPGTVLRVPYDVDPAGNVVGTTGAYGTDTSAAILWRDGTTTRLGAPTGMRFTSAHGASGTGLVAGAGHNGYDGSRALLWDASGHATDLGTLGGAWARAAAINAAGDVVGASALASSPFSRAFLYRNGAMIDLGTLPGRAGSTATAISDAGHIVGNSASFAGATTAFIYSGGEMNPLDPGDGFVQSFAYDVNARGEAVGAVVRTNGRFEAALWDESGVTVLGSLGGAFVSAKGINSHAQVVGRSVDAAGVETAFLWEDGAMTALSTLVDGGWSIVTAEKINDAGHIIGTARLGGSEYAVLLSPITIPAPTTLAIITLPALLAARRRR